MCYDPKYGGRGVITELETLLIDNLSSFIFSNYEIWMEKIKQNKILKIEMSIIQDNVDFKIANIK